MDLDKLKKAAWDKTMSFKIFKEQPDDKDLHEDPAEETREFNAFTEKMNVVMDGASPDDDTSLGSTKRFNLRDMLSELKKKSQDFLYDENDDADNAEQADSMDTDDDAFSTVSGEQAKKPEKQPISSQAEREKPVFMTPEANSEPIVEELKKCIDDIKAGIGRIEAADAALIAKDSGADDQSQKLDDISRRLSTIKNMLEKQSDSSTKSVVNINAKLNAQDERLTDITSSLGSVSKLNDSVFDLKNTQMNTRNSIDELETSFRYLKKKMTVGITLISILSAVLIVLEVLNLLS